MKQFDQIPTEEPLTPLLDQIKIPEILRGIPESQLPQLADELREWLLYSVGQTGGHFGAGLGVIELTIALHYVFRTPDDSLVWDVGHQAYPHKILTGRRDAMSTLRQWGGIGAFPSREESRYDTFGVGHSSTSISAALGMAISDQLNQQQRKTVAIIGDGAMTGGMAFEALAHAGHEKSNLLVVLNDNQMSISENVGGLSNYFARIWASRAYNQLKSQSKRLLKRKPVAFDIARRTEEHVKGLVSGRTLFEELGFNYIGPINGHDLGELVLYLKKIKNLDGPQLLHVITQKGQGFTPAEDDPVGYHALTKIEFKAKSPTSTAQKKPKFSSVFGQWVCDMADLDPDLVAITPAMREGSDLVAFSKKHPARYFDVAIAEQHAVTFAAGLACNGKKPVVAIYSTFFQRAYDQLIHDVALQNLNLLFAVDRAGLVGEDGATHNGAFDISFLRCIPNMVLMTPSDENLCRQMLATGFGYPGPVAVRYPRGTGPGVAVETQMSPVAIGRGHLVREGRQVAILAFGPLLHAAQQVAHEFNLTLVDMRFVKPLDESLLIDLVARHEGFVTLEENVVAGGAGVAVSECLTRHNITQPMRHLGLPDSFLGHGRIDQLHAQCGLDEAGIRKSLVEFLDYLGEIPTLTSLARVQLSS